MVLGLVISLNKRTKDIIVASVAIGTAAVALYFGFAGRSQKINLDPYEVLGTVTAEETAKLLGNKGEVLVMAPDTGANKNPSVEAELKAFRRTLEKQKGMSVVAERVSITAMLMLATGGGVPPEQFFKVLDSHKHIGAIVLFFGFPQLTDPELARFKKYGVKTIVVSSFRSNYKGLMEQHVIDLAVVPRPDAPPPAPTPPNTMRERFDQDFYLVTPAEAAKLP